MQNLLRAFWTRMRGGRQQATDKMRDVLGIYPNIHKLLLAYVPKITQLLIIMISVVSKFNKCYNHTDLHTCIAN